MSLSSKSGSLASGFLIFAALLSLPSSVAGEEPAAAEPNPGRVVAIGDIHGEFEGLVSILQETGLIDSQLRWIGGNTTLVQTGDFLDRGPMVRRVVELLLKLERQAVEQGGRLIVLMGNHEIMNLLGDYRSVTPEIYASFATDGSDKRRKEEYKQWVNWLSRLMRSRGQRAPQFNEEVKRRWIEGHPLGFFEYQDAMGPEGAYGPWISRLPVSVKIGDTLFQHAGISSEFAQYDLEAINRMHWEEIDHFQLNRAALVEEGIIPSFATMGELYRTTHPENRSGRSKKHKALLEKAYENLKVMEKLFLGRASPLWFRGYSPPSPDGSFGLADEELEPLLEKLTEVYGTEHFVAAHSSASGGAIRQRLGGKVFLIDTGMLKSYPHGRPSALEIQGGRFTAVYVNERQVLLDSRQDVMPAAGTSARTFRMPPRFAPALTKTDQARILPAALTSQMAGSPQSRASERVWLDPEGNPLPFKSHEETLEFLKEARVVSTRDIPRGVTKPIQALLEKGGVQARAAFRYVDRYADRQRLADGTMVMHFRDTYVNEVAAYDLSRLLGLDNVPPTTRRELNGQPGSIQLWIEGGQLLVEWREENPANTPDPTTTSLYLKRQVHDMRVFDILVNNIDRSAENIMWDSNWNLWLIDHSRAFGRDRSVPRAHWIKKCSRTLWQGIKALDEEEVKARLSPYMGNFEIKALLQRRKKVIRLIEKKIQTSGEERVLFNYGDPRPPGVKITIEEAATVPPAHTEAALPAP